MSMLHTVNKSPYERSTLGSCLAHLKDGDTVLMVEDGVIAARAGGKPAKQIEGAMKGCAVYALGPDLAARGIKEESLIDGIKVVDYGGYVDLVAEHDVVQAWL